MRGYALKCTESAMGDCNYSNLTPDLVVVKEMREVGSLAHGIPYEIIIVDITFSQLIGYVVAEKKQKYEEMIRKMEHCRDHHTEDDGFKLRGSFRVATILVRPRMSFEEIRQTCIEAGINQISSFEAIHAVVSVFDLFDQECIRAPSIHHLVETRELIISVPAMREYCSRFGYRRQEVNILIDFFGPYLDPDRQTFVNGLMNYQNPFYAAMGAVWEKEFHKMPYACCVLKAALQNNFYNVEQDKPWNFLVFLLDQHYLSLKFSCGASEEHREFERRVLRGGHLSEHKVVNDILEKYFQLAGSFQPNRIANTFQANFLTLDKFICD